MKLAKGAVVAAVILAVAGGAAAFAGLLPLPTGGDGPGGGESRSEASPEASGAQEVVTSLDEIIVDIAARTVAGESARRFLKTELALVYEDADAAERGAGREAHIRDAFTDYLRQLDERDLLGSAGLARMRADLLHRARVLLGPDAPVQVLVAELVVQ